MTCKDCIHYNVCSKLCTGIDMNLFMKDDNTTASESCIDFKDKSKFVELPCNVGDKYYRIEKFCNYDGDLEKVQPWDCEVCECKDCKDCKYELLINEYTFRSLEEIIKNKSYINLHLIFLTKEEAEAKLKEVENNEQ